MTADLAARAALPSHLSGVLAALPKDTHPMVQFSTAVLALQVRPRLAPTLPCSARAPCHAQLGIMCLLPAHSKLGNGWSGQRCVRVWLSGLAFSGGKQRRFNMGGARRQPASQFAAAYARGVPKTKYWEYAYEDSMDLIAKLPGVAAHIYRATYHGGKHIGLKPDLDWAANLSHMMGACPCCPALCKAGAPAGP